MKEIIVMAVAMVLAMICMTGCSVKEILNIHDVSRVSNSCTLQAGTEQSSWDDAFYIVDGEVMSIEEYEEWEKTNKGWWR